MDERSEHDPKAFSLGVVLPPVAKDADAESSWSSNSRRSKSIFRTADDEPPLAWAKLLSALGVMKVGWTGVVLFSRFSGRGFFRFVGVGVSIVEFSLGLFHAAGVGGIIWASRRFLACACACLSRCAGTEGFFICLARSAYLRVLRVSVMSVSDGDTQLIIEVQQP